MSPSPAEMDYIEPGPSTRTVRLVSVPAPVSPCPSDCPEKDDNNGKDNGNLVIDEGQAETSLERAERLLDDDFSEANLESTTNDALLDETMVMSPIPDNAPATPQRPAKKRKCETDNNNKVENIKLFNLNDLGELSDINAFTGMKLQLTDTQQQDFIDFYSTTSSEKQFNCLCLLMNYLFIYFNYFIVLSRVSNPVVPLSRMGMLCIS